MRCQVTSYKESPHTVLNDHILPVLVSQEGLQADGDGGGHHVVQGDTTELSPALGGSVVRTLGHVSRAAAVLAQGIVQVVNH